MMVNIPAKLHRQSLSGSGIQGGPKRVEKSIVTEPLKRLASVFRGNANFFEQD